MKTYKLVISGERFEAQVIEYNGTHAKININGTDYMVEILDDALSNVPKLGQQDQSVPLAPAFSSDFDLSGGEMRAPIPGVIVSIPVKEGDKVIKGQTIIVLEAMKMESEIASPIDAVIAKILVKERSPVQEGDVLMILSGEEVKGKTASSRPRVQGQQAAAQPVEKSMDNILRAPIPGMIIEIKVRPGDRIREDQVALVLEAMKMESDIHSTRKGKVKKVYVQKGDSVQEGDPLIEIEE
ncbi:MAG: biotin/lipoyl-containing protein [Candidatus Cloacimonadaceae bacterium]|nr:biotin/lipoyl-containing protein [Candidatus Cloacimonadaceae bacterium]